MKTWSIPAKTFLLGEYAALMDGRAILLTTTPCFELTLTKNPGLQGIHPDSPAGRLWQTMGLHEYGLHWHDPYHHRGGMGASSAQFLGTYWVTSFLNQTQPSEDGMLEAYWQCAWEGKGSRPSGYDVIAQSLSGCVSIHQHKRPPVVFTWPFRSLALMLVHTGQKLATHRHLLETTPNIDVDRLNAIVAAADDAFNVPDASSLIEAVNAYHCALVAMQAVDEHTLQLIAGLEGQPGLLAIKGCGAMGADVLLLLTTLTAMSTIKDRLADMKLSILATHNDIFFHDTSYH